MSQATSGHAYGGDQGMKSDHIHNVKKHLDSVISK